MTTGHSNVSGLDAAYRATAYVAEIEHGDIVIRIDQPSTALDQWLQAKGCKDWAFISACNPGSLPLPQALNVERHAQLVAAVEALGLTWRPGRGVPDRPGWQPEPSLLILDIASEEALRLAAGFGQNAIVAGSIGSSAKLHYVHGN